MLRDHGLDPASDANDGFDELGDSPQRELIDGQPFPFALPAPKLGEVLPPTIAQPGYLQPHARRPPDEFGQRTDRDRTTVIYYTHAVADSLGFLQGVSVQKHRRPG